MGFLNIPLEKNFLAYKNIKKKWNNLLEQSKKKNIKNSDKGAATSNISHSGIQSNPLLLIQLFKQMKTIEAKKNENQN